VLADITPDGVQASSSRGRDAGTAFPELQALAAR
jgi:hypothetical protein